MYGTAARQHAGDKPTSMVTVCGFAAVAAVAGVMSYHFASQATAAQLHAAAAAVRPMTRVQGASVPFASQGIARTPLQPVQVARIETAAPVATAAIGQVTGTFCAIALGLTAMGAFVAALLRREPQTIAMAATSGRQTWIPGGAAPAHLTGEFPADRGFDPIGLSKDPSTFERMRASEVFHGRLAMLGFAGSILPELQGKGPWYEIVDKQFGPGPTGEVLDFTSLAVVGMIFSFPVEYWRGNGGFGWGEQKGDRAYPGFDPLNLTTFDTKTREIKNGRLAMLAMAGFAIQYNATGVSPLENLAAVTGKSIAMFAASGERPVWFPGAQAPPHLTGQYPGDRGFDPVDFAVDPIAFERMRASEVFHGRLAMLGVVGAIAPEVLGKGAWNQLPEYVDYSTQAQLGLGCMLLIAPVEYWRGNGGFGWDQSERNKGNRIYPGFDPLKLTTEETKLKEIKNGRLAMIAMAGLFAQANTTGGASPLENLLHNNLTAALGVAMM